jgi:hypothetical protein
VRFSRLTFGIVAAGVATAVTTALALVLYAHGDHLRPRVLLLVFAAVAGAVMWLGEGSGVMRDAFQESPEPVLGLDKRRSS